MKKKHVIFHFLYYALTIVMLLAALTGCMASKNPSGSEGGQNPSGNTGGVPLPAISVRSLAELEKMREMVSCTDEEKLNEYLRSVEGGGARKRDDLVSFLDLIDSLPVLELFEGNIAWIAHLNIVAGSKNDSVVISTEGVNGEWVRVEYLISIKDVQAEIELRKNDGDFENSTIDTPIQSNDGRITVYSEVKAPHPSGTGDTVTWVIVMDGIMTRVVCHSEEIDGINAESVFANPKITTIKAIL